MKINGRRSTAFLLCGGRACYSEVLKTNAPLYMVALVLIDNCLCVLCISHGVGYIFSKFIAEKVVKCIKNCTVSWIVIFLFIFEVSSYSNDLVVIFGGSCHILLSVRTRFPLTKCFCNKRTNQGNSLCFVTHVLVPQVWAM